MAKVPVSIELTPGEIFALGFALTAGAAEAETRGERELRRLVLRVMAKIWISNERVARQKPRKKGARRG